MEVQRIAAATLDNGTDASCSSFFYFTSFCPVFLSRPKNRTRGRREQIGNGPTSKEKCDTTGKRSYTGESGNDEQPLSRADLQLKLSRSSKRTRFCQFAAIRPGPGFLATILCLFCSDSRN
ncbi:uncharacterized protein DS421_9g266600 [Arachis hypogaea]|nr:uncharacterized protein DS421_9g266600 [Arachis hypogaea]